MYMSEYSYLSPKQERYLLLSVDKLEDTITKGIDKIYQWDLQREVKFVNKVLSDRAYDMFYDSDRLNSIQNLINHIDNKSY